MEDISKCQSNIIKTSKNTGLIDVIVLTCNGLNITKKFLELFYKNTKKELFHLIVIDNGSKDETPDFLKDFSKNNEFISVILNSANLGVIRGRNLGYYLSSILLNKKSKYLMFLDNDQYIQPRCLEHHLSVLNEGYDLVGVEAWQLNNRFMPVKKIENIKEHFTYVGCGGMLMKKEVPEKVGMFDIIFNPAYFEDPDFNIKSYQAGFKIGWNISAKLVHLPHQTLGKISQQEKIKQFTSSLNKFRDKWKNTKLPIMYQKYLKQFGNNI